MVAVRELLSREELALSFLVEADADAEVRWVATSELEDPTPFLEGGEVLLTTGIETKGWRSQWRPYVSRLRSAGVVALGLGTGLTHRRPPQGLVNACRSEGLNLFEVPTQTSFVNVSRAAVHLLEGAEQSRARRVVAAQRELTAAALASDPEDAILRSVAHLVDGSASMFGADGERTRGPLPKDAGALDDDRIRGEIQRMRPLGMRAASAFSDPLISTSVQPIGIEGRPKGYLVVTTPGRIDEANRTVTTTALSLLSLAAEKREQDRARSRDLEAEAWTLMLADQSAAADALLRAAGRDPVGGNLHVLAVSGDDEVIEEFRAGAEQRRGFGLGVVTDGRLFTVWVSGVPTGIVADAERRGLRAGVGEPQVLAGRDEGQAFPRAVRTAGQAHAATSDHRPTVTWKDLASEGVMGLIDTEAAGVFAERLLDPLDDELIATLSAFLDHHGSRVATAEVLGVHRNTVRNRIEMIEQAWGTSLDDPQTRVDAWIALRLQDR